MGGEHHRDHHTHDDVHDREEEILELLRADGGRVTTGRRAIVRALLTGPDHHVTADDMATAVQAEHPDVHVSTVYRTLEALERLEVVGRIAVTGERAVFHLNDHAHHHLVCDRCHAVFELPQSAMAGLTRAAATRHGFAVAPRHQRLTGLCRRCRGS